MDGTQASDTTNALENARFVRVTRTITYDLDRVKGDYRASTPDGDESVYLSTEDALEIVNEWASEDMISGAGSYTTAILDAEGNEIIALCDGEPI
jgi:hypothetical protein